MCQHGRSGDYILIELEIIYQLIQMTIQIALKHIIYLMCKFNNKLLHSIHLWKISLLKGTKERSLTYYKEKLVKESTQVLRQNVSITMTN